jgi:hypothetical protein
MRRTAVVLSALAFLGAAPGAAAQAPTPFGPLGAPAPSEEEPAPQPAPQPQPMQQSPLPERADDSLAMGETMSLLGLSILLFAVIAVAIGRDARRATAPRKKTLTRRSSRANRARVGSVAK